MYARVGFNTIMYYILERRIIMLAGTILSTHSFMHTCRKKKTPIIAVYGHTGIKRSISTNAHKIKENHPMREPMGDATLNSDN
jgi:hypothetical protein